MQDSTKTLLVGGVAFVIALAIGFSVGLRYSRIRAVRSSQAASPMMGRRFGMMGSRGFSRGFSMDRGGVSGQVVAVSGNQITLKLFDGRIEKVTLSNSTTYTKTSAVGQVDLQIGQNIIVSGQSVSDGSIAAQAIRVGAK